MRCPSATLAPRTKANSPPTHAHSPPRARQAWLYNPYAPAGARFRLMASSPIKRLYHSTALLMPDGNVLVMGSEQGACSVCVRPEQVGQGRAPALRAPLTRARRARTI